MAEIAQVASRFGLDVLLARFGMADTAADGDDPATLPARARQALETLGPVFVKLGQILATRGDLLTPEWTAELEKLHSSAPALPFADLREQVEAALGGPPETAFAHFDERPIAAGSIAQVHRATLHDGREVVAKIRRPGIRPQMEADLRFIARFAAIAETASADARRMQPGAMVRQLAEAVLEELDFTTEGRNTDRMRADFAAETRIVVPGIHRDWTSESLLVMDYVEGVPPRDGETLRAAGADPDMIAALGADAVLDMMLVNGRFHADPHPGNLLVLPGNRLALLDLGMIGHVSPRRREEMIGFVTAFATGDPARLAEVLIAWTAGSGLTRERVMATAERLIARHGGHIVLGAMVGDFLQLMREEKVAMPPDLLLIFKAMITIDGVLRAIAPDFDLTQALQRSAIRIARAYLSPSHWEPGAQSLALEIARIGHDAPRLLRAATRRLEADEAAPDAGTAQAAAIATAGRWIAASVLAGFALVAGAIVFA